MSKEELNRAIALSRSGEKTEARQILNAILDVDPQNQTAWLWLADTYADTSNRIRVLEDCIKHIPDSQIVQKWLTTFKAKEEARKASADQEILPDFEDNPDEDAGSGSQNAFDQQIDCRGLFCPMPILKTKKAMDALQTGQVLQMKADDPNVLADVEAWTSQTGHELIGHEKEGEQITFYIKCR